MNDVLVLNFTYEALNITTFQRAVKLIFSGKAEVVHGRDHRAHVASSRPLISAEMANAKATENPT